MSENIRQERINFANDYFGFVNAQRNVIFLDEVGFQYVSRSKGGRAMRGQPAVATMPDIRSKNINVIAAMTKDRLLLYKILDSTTTGVKFQGYINELANTCHVAMIENPILVMDNKFSQNELHTRGHGEQLIRMGLFAGV